MQAIELVNKLCGTSVTLIEHTVSALKAIQKAVGDRVDVLLELGISLTLLGDQRQAEACLSMAAKADAGRSESLMYLSQLKILSNELEEAATTLDFFGQVAPSDLSEGHQSLFL